MNTAPTSAVHEFAQKSVDESLALISDSVGHLLQTMIRVSASADPVAAMAELNEACRPFQAISDRASWVSHVANVSPNDPSYTEHIVNTTPPLGS